ncbi:tetratricopeptide repeat protein [Spongiimicrobium sp. 3-5]|uniref:SH3 domain-containing protein n=1 Tax=Spongiimicrobium sp. 3-5 TaxID=3332596 RepID=UPI00398035FC
MKKLTIILILLPFFLGSAQNNALFSRATKAYNAGEYEKAVESYLKILDNGEHSAELYYNLGNAYYKMSQIAPSIYYYEKALLLKPNDPEIKNNLSFAQNMTLDAIEQLPETGLSKIYRNIVEVLSFEQWAYVSVVCIMIFVLAYLLFYFLRYSSHKRIAFVSSIVALIIGVISILLAYIEYTDFSEDQPAIVFQEESIVKSEPNNRSQQAFKLHEGTKVNVLEVLDDWKKIALVDGKTGWISSEDIKLLKDF